MITDILAAQTAIQTKDIGHFVLVTGMVATMLRSVKPITDHCRELIENLQTYHRIKDEMHYDHTLDLKTGKEKLSAPYMPADMQVMLNPVMT